MKTVIVTGSNPLTAKYTTERAGVSNYIAEAKPGDGMNCIREEQKSGKLVTVVRDDINDAPVLARVNTGVTMNSDMQVAKGTGDMVDLGNDPTKLIEIVGIGGQSLMTHSTLTILSIVNNVVKYLAIVSTLFVVTILALTPMNIMHLHSPGSATLSVIIFSVIIIPILIPLALRGVAYESVDTSTLSRRNLLVYGLDGVVVPFIGIKLVDMIVNLFM